MWIKTNFTLLQQRAADWVQNEVEGNSCREIITKQRHLLGIIIITSHSKHKQLHAEHAFFLKPGQGLHFLLVHCSAGCLLATELKIRTCTKLQLKLTTLALVAGCHVAPSLQHTLSKGGPPFLPPCSALTCSLAMLPLATFPVSTHQLTCLYVLAVPWSFCLSTPIQMCPLS